MNNAKPALSSRAQDILQAFGQQPDVTPTHLRNLTAAIESSPVLVDQMNTLVAAGHLKTIAPMKEAHPHADGVYDDQGKADTIRLPLAKLKPVNRPFDCQDVTFVVAHEFEHGLNYKERHDAYANFDNAVLGTTRDRSPRDYTPAVADFLAERRRDEAEGQIAGWNAVVSALDKKHEQDGKPLTLEEIYKSDKYRMKDFIDVGRGNPVSYSLKPNLTLNKKQNFTLHSSDANVEAVSKNFVDKSGEQAALGPLGKSDYANYYGAYALGRIAQLEREYNPIEQHDNVPHITLNLSKLHLSTQRMEQNGVDLGTNQYELLINDSSRHPPMIDAIRHIGATATEIREPRQREVASSAVPSPATGAQSALENAPLYAELKQRLPPETSHDRLAQINVAARIGGVGQGQLQDVIVRDDAVFVSGKIPFGHARIDLTTPPPPAHESAQQWGIYHQQQAQQMTQFHTQQTQINAQQRPTMGGASAGGHGF